MGNHWIITLEEKGCFDFFWNEVSRSEAGFGLIRDNTMMADMASIASVGFGLCAIPIGVHNHWITWEEGEERAYRTLVTMDTNVDQLHGFYYHFLEMDTGKRYNNCECSIIDTALFVMGALAAAQYFKGRVAQVFERIYGRIDWDWYRNKETNQFYMGYDDQAHPGKHFGAWDLYAEQLIMYVLACGSPTHPLPESIYYDCPLDADDYGPYKDIYHSHTGSLFVYQFSHAFLDLMGKTDKRGIDWFENSVKATRANRQFCMDHSGQFKTFHGNSWGMTACDSPRGYSGIFGAPPSRIDNVRENDGTIPPCGAIGSIVFTPQETIAAMEDYHKNSKLWGIYGFIDAYNLDVEPAWYSQGYIGIDKGISIVMLENYKSGLIWDLVSDSPYVKKGMEVLGIK